MTVRNLEIVEVDTEDNVILVKGAVPGPNGGYVMVRRAKRLAMPSVDIIDLSNKVVGTLESGRRSFRRAGERESAV